MRRRRVALAPAAWTFRRSARTQNSGQSVFRAPAAGVAGLMFCGASLWGAGVVAGPEPLLLPPPHPTAATATRQKSTTRRGDIMPTLPVAPAERRHTLPRHARRHHPRRRDPRRG